MKYLPLAATALLLTGYACVADAHEYRYTHHDCADISTCEKVGTHEVTCEKWAKRRRRFFGLDNYHSNYENRNARCSCLPGFAGQRCNVCAGGHGVFPHCTAESTAVLQSRAEEKKRGEVADTILKLAGDNKLAGYNRAALMKETSTALTAQLGALKAKVADLMKRGEVADTILKLAGDNKLTGYNRAALMKETPAALTAQLGALKAKVADLMKRAQVAGEIAKIAEANGLTGYDRNVLVKQSAPELTATLNALRDYVKMDQAGPQPGHYQPEHAPQVNVEL